MSVPPSSKKFPPIRSRSNSTETKVPEDETTLKSILKEGKTSKEKDVSSLFSAEETKSTETSEEPKKFKNKVHYDEVSKTRIPYVDKDDIHFDQKDKIGIAKSRDGRSWWSDSRYSFTETKRGPKKSVDEMIKNKKKLMTSEDKFKGDVRHFNLYINRMKQKYKENNEVLETLMSLEKCRSNFPTMHVYIISGVEENKIENLKLVNAYSVVLKESMNKLISVEFPLEVGTSSGKKTFEIEHLEVLKKESEAVINKYLNMELPLINIYALMLHLDNLKNDMLDENKYSSAVKMPKIV